MGSLKYRVQLPLFISIISNVKCINASGSRERNLQLLLSMNMLHLSVVWLKEMPFPKPLPNK